MKNTNNIETDDFKLPFVGREKEQTILVVLFLHHIFVFVQNVAYVAVASEYALR